VRAEDDCKLLRGLEKKSPRKMNTEIVSATNEISTRVNGLNVDWYFELDIL
jgi:hypothetical protein